MSARHGAYYLFQRQAVAVVGALQASGYDGERRGSEQAVPPVVIDNVRGRIGQGAQGR